MSTQYRCDVCGKVLANRTYDIRTNSGDGAVAWLRTMNIVNGRGDVAIPMKDKGDPIRFSLGATRHGNNSDVCWRCTAQMIIHFASTVSKELKE